MSDQDTQDLVTAGEIAAELAVMAVDEVPIVGKPLSFVLDQVIGTAMGELNKQPPVWDLVSTEVTQAIRTNSVAEHRDLLRVKLTAMKDSIARLDKLTDGPSSSSYISELISRETLARETMTSFMPDEPAAAYYALPFFMPVANLHLALLRTKRLWAESHKDVNLPAYQADFAATARKYCLYATYMPGRAIEWRTSCVTITEEDESMRSALLRTIPKIFKDPDFQKPDSKGYGRTFTYTDTEKPETNSVSNDSQLAVPPAMEAKQTAVEADSRKLMAETVDAGLRTWMNSFLWQHDLSRDFLFGGILCDETWDPHYPGTWLRVQGDEIELRTTDTEEYLWGRRFPGKRIFLSVDDHELSIRSGLPHQGGRLEEQLCATPSSTTQTSTLQWLHNYPATADRKGWLGVRKDTKVSVGGTVDDDIDYAWDSETDVATVSKKMKTRARARIPSVVFCCTFSDEGHYIRGQTNYTSDRAEVDALRLSIEIDGASTDVVSWSSGFFGAAWEVRKGSVRSYTPTWSTTIDLGAKPETLVRFRAHTSEHDFGSPNDDADADLTMTIGEIAERLRRAGGRYRWNHRIHLRNDEVAFLVDVAFDLDAR